MTSTPLKSESAPKVMQGGVVLREVTKQYGSFTAVEQLNLSVEPGSYTCLLGPSGCGKTTTLRMIAGHEESTSGELWIGDRKVNGIPAAKRDTAMVFQNYALFPHKTVRDNIAFGLKMRGVPRAERQRRTAEILALVDLEEFARRKPDQLSGGQQQRVALARALVIRPQVILLDEPLSALDESLRLRTRLELRKLQKQFGLTFIQVTHAQDEAFSLSDQVVVMDRGRIDQVGTPEQIFNRPASRFVAQFVGDNNILQGTVAGIRSNEAGNEIELRVEGLGSVFCQAFSDGSASHAAAAEVSVGQQAACCVRGDRLHLLGEKPAIASHRNGASYASATAPNQARINRITARVSAVEFTGFVSRISITLEPGGLEFLMKARTDDWIRSGCQEGQRVELGWYLEDCIFLAQ